MTASLFNLARHGDISWLSYYFAEFICHQDQTTLDGITALSAALVCEANLAGDVCVDLGQYDNKPLFRSMRLQDSEMPKGPALSTWCSELESSHCVGTPRQSVPLILDGKNLYLSRYWIYENFVGNNIKARLDRGQIETAASLQSKLGTLFSDSASTDPDQRQAVLTAATRSFSVISGGPGSGKTSTVVRILALLLSLKPDIRIALAAPTGKAAARMVDSIRERIDQLDIDENLKQALPREAHTIHRLLRYRHNGFDHDDKNPLALDCLVVDEASMIDLKLMYHLLLGLPAETQLILLGDRDQLASVAAGNVLGDITGHGLDDEAGPMRSAIALLRTNYRFSRDSAIGELALHVNQGNQATALTLLRQGERGLLWHESGQEALEPTALAYLLEAFQAVFDSSTAAEALSVFESIRILVCTNSGPLGADILNRMISNEMLARNRQPEGELFSGLPIMITRNQHDLELFNGDTGILWDSGSGLRACFRDANRGIREFSLYRLPEFTPAWASTVHKAQGSEFDTVFLLLPADPESETLSRELLYTAITRARQQFILHGSSSVAAVAIDRITRRRSGLARKLGWRV